MDELLVQIDRQNYAITTNFDTIKAQLEETLKNYKGIIVDESTIKQSKADLADLRKMSKEIDDVRKEIKSQWEQPYNEFNSNCKALQELINEPINEIKDQLDVFEEKRKQEKMNHVRELYDENIGEFGEYLPFEIVFKEKWLNATASDKDIKYDISEAVTKVRAELESIKALHSEIEAECFASYKNAGNSLTAAIAKNSDYIKAKELAQKRLEEEKRLEAEKKAREEEQKKVEEQIAAIPEEGFMNPPEEEPTETPIWEVPAEETLTFRITGSEEIQKVKEMLDFNDIEYEVI